MEKTTIVGLDIGTTKIGVVIGEVNEEGTLRIVGLGTSPSTGLLKGVVVNIDATVKSITKAVEEAELMAGIDVNEVFVGIAGRHIRSLAGKGMIAINNADNEITHQDVARVIEQASTMKMPGDRQILHVIPQGFTVDDQTGIKDPVGMSGVKLQGDVHIVSGAVTSVQNIYKSVERSGLQVADVVLEPLASAHAVLDEDEREIGVAVVDMGGGTTDLAIFTDNSIRHTSSIAFGGDNVTSDLAIGIRTPKEKAEDIKKQHGTCREAKMDNDEHILVAGVGGRQDKEFSKAFLAKIIRARMREIFQHVARELDRSRLRDKIGAGIVLTGGGALVDGAVELAEEIFDMPVKLGVPQTSGGLSDVVTSPMHATGVGLVVYGWNQMQREDYEGTSSRKGEGVKDVFSRLLGWVRNYI